MIVGRDTERLDMTESQRQWKLRRKILRTVSQPAFMTRRPGPGWIYKQHTMDSYGIQERQVSFILEGRQNLTISELHTGEFLRLGHDSPLSAIKKIMNLAVPMRRRSLRGLVSTTRAQIRPDGIGLQRSLRSAFGDAWCYFWKTCEEEIHWGQSAAGRDRDILGE